MSTQHQDNNVDLNPLLVLPPEPEADPQNQQHLLTQDLHQQYHYLRSIQSTLLIRQLPSQGLSFQLWPAATTLLTLLDHPTTPLSAFLTAQSHRRLRILELGAGTGLVGIAASAILGADVTVTDLPHVLPNLKFNAQVNSDVLAVQGGTVRVAPLRWGEDEDAEGIGREYDVIVGSDVVYHDHLYEPLIKSLRFLLLGGGEKMVFLMAHLRRWKKESGFFKKAKKYFHVEVIHADAPLNGARVGVVVYCFREKSGGGNKKGGSSTSTSG